MTANDAGASGSFLNYTSDWPSSPSVLFNSPYDWLFRNLDLDTSTDDDDAFDWGLEHLLDLIQMYDSEKISWEPLAGPGPLYCLAPVPEQRCELRFSLDLAITVILSKYMKLILMLAVALRFGIEDRHLATVVDATVSFMEDPDIVTKGRCNLSRAQ